MSKPKEHSPFIMLGEKGTEAAPAPLYRQIYEAIRAAILSGEFGSRMRLPATRALARQLGVSRITVVNAYEQLLAEGYLEGKTGAGTFVAAELPDDLLQASGKKLKKQDDIQNAAVLKPATAASAAPLDLSPFGQKLAAKNLESARARTDGADGAVGSAFEPFQNGLTAVDQFPFDDWSRIAARISRNPPREVLGYGDPRGLASLREAVAAHLKSARGVNCTPRQVIITSGAQQALDLTARIFLGERDAVLIEDPCYPEARNSFSATGARVIPVPVDEEGLNLAGVDRTRSAKLVYVTPSHQYPLGVTMSLPRRLALIEWAKKNNARVVEDDYNSEFRYAGRPLAALQGLDRTGTRVIYVGTFSKTIFPSLRIGCVVVPEELIDIFAAARGLNDVHSSLIDQAILSEFIAEGHFARHVRRMRALYEKRQRILVDECENNLKGLLEVEKAAAGMHLVGWLPAAAAGVSDKAISRIAAAPPYNLKLAPISAYCAGKLARGGFILGYTAFDEKQIKDGVKKMRAILSAAIAN